MDGVESKVDPKRSLAVIAAPVLPAPRHDFPLPKAQVCLVETFLAPEEAASVFDELLASIRPGFA